MGHLTRSPGIRPTRAVRLIPWVRKNRMPSVFMTCWETSGSGVKAGLVHTVTMQRLTLWEGRPATSTPRVVVVTTATPYMNAPLGEIVTSRTIPPEALASGSPQSREKLATIRMERQDGSIADIAGAMPRATAE